MLVKRLGPKARGKLTDFWEEIPYMVVRQPNPQNPVYVVRPLQVGGNDRILHRNLLRPCSLDLDEGQPVQSGHAESTDGSDSSSVPWVMFMPETGSLVNMADQATNPPEGYIGLGPTHDRGDEGMPRMDRMEDHEQIPALPLMQSDGGDLRRSTRPTRGVPPKRFMFTE